MFLKNEFATANTLQVRAGTAINLARHRRPCVGGTAAIDFAMGTPTPGNLAFSLPMSGAAPGALTACGISLGEGQTTSGGCSIWLDLSPEQFDLPTPLIGVLSASANGTASLPLPIPSLPQLSGLVVFAQWMTADPVGRFLAFGGSWHLSGSRRILIW